MLKVVSLRGNTIKETWLMGIWAWSGQKDCNSSFVIQLPQQCFTEYSMANIV